MIPTRTRALLALSAVLLAVPPRASAQPRRSRNQLTVDMEVVGATVGYARTRESGPDLGFELGVGGSFLDRMLLSGRHFSDENGPSYEARDGEAEKELFELAHVAVFTRWGGPSGWRADAGVRASAFLHWDTSDDDPGLPLFLGGYGSFQWGGRRFSVGPRLLVGAFSEGAGRTELGVYLVPLTGRVTFGW